MAGDGSFLQEEYCVRRNEKSIRKFGVRKWAHVLTLNSSSLGL